MPISMSPFAHYVTQSSVYSSPFTGALTDRRIRHYQKLDYYKTNTTAERVTERKVKAAKRRLSKEQVFARFDL